MNPFNLQSALLAKHAQHVVLIHFPIALFVTGVVFDAAARWWKQAALATAAYFNLLAAAVSVVPALATGLLAWQWQLEGQRLRGVLLLHLVLGCACAVLIGLAGWMQFRRRGRDTATLARWSFVLEMMTTIVVAITAHLGGFLSGVNRPG